MTYPDGSRIRVGDLIWWDEGLCVGYVQAIAESKEEYESWGLAAPHIYVSNTHPFDPATRDEVGYPMSALEDDGVGLLSPEERGEFEEATAEAHSLAVSDLDGLIYSVTTEVQKCELVDWIFTFIKDRRVVEVIRIPAKVKRS